MNTLCTATLVLVCCVRSAIADDPSVASQQNTDDDAAGVSVFVTPAGLQRHVPGKWATVAVNGINRSSTDTEATVTVIVGDNPNLQFTRRLWIPSQSRRQSWLPILIPNDLTRDTQQIEMTSIHLRQSARGEQFQTNVQGMPTSKRSLLLSWENSRTALLFDRLTPAKDQRRRKQQLTEMVYVGRDLAIGSSQDLGMINLGSDFLPPSPTALDSLDQIVIAGDRFLADTSSVARLRSWLRSGGRMWVMLDQVEPQSVRRLLGDAASYSVVDRVQLNAFEIHPVVPPGIFQRFESEQWESEIPVEMVRVLAEADEVQCRINGWPAAFWKQVGAGEVLFTTLAADGWLQPNDGASSDRKPLSCYRRLSRRLFVNRIPPPSQTARMTSLLDSEIGYQIPSRRWIGGLLSLHILVVLVAGAWLARIQKLQRLAAVVPIAALVAAGGLIAIGKQRTSAIPSTIATVQLAQAEHNSPEVRVESLAAIYSQDSRLLQIESSSETTTMLDQTTLGSEIQRVLWTDDGRSRWQDVRQPTGVVRYARSDSTVTTAAPWLVAGTFTDQGFRGRIVGFDSLRCEDGVIIAGPSPALAVQIRSGRSREFTSGWDSVLPPNQFFDVNLMSDVQRDRQRLLRDMTSAQFTPFDPQPTMWLWTEPTAEMVDFGDGFEHRGSALASLPIHYRRPPIGSKFRVPASFVRLELGPGNRGGSSVFNPRTGRWLEEMNRPNQSVLRCLVPRVLLPCKLSRAKVVIRINAPSRALEIRGDVGGQFVTLFQKQNPNGVLEFTIDRDDALQLDSNGSMLLSIVVTATDQERQIGIPTARSVYDMDDAPTDASQTADPEDLAVPSRSTWEIEYVHVHLEGKTE